MQMSDVESGGATVFPNFGLRIPPSKVSPNCYESVFMSASWLFRVMLHIGGISIERAMETCVHVMQDVRSWWAPNGVSGVNSVLVCCDCVAVVVCNKWIHERGQEFRRPCALSADQ